MTAKIEEAAELSVSAPFLDIALLCCNVAVLLCCYVAIWRVCDCKNGRGGRTQRERAIS